MVYTDDEITILLNPVLFLQVLIADVILNLVFHLKKLTYFFKVFFLLRLPPTYLKQILGISIRVTHTAGVISNLVIHIKKILFLSIFL